MLHSPIEIFILIIAAFSGRHGTFTLVKNITDFSDDMFGALCNNEECHLANTDE